MEEGRSVLAALLLESRRLLKLPTKPLFLLFWQGGIAQSSSTSADRFLLLDRGLTIARSPQKGKTADLGNLTLPSHVSGPPLWLALLSLLLASGRPKRLVVKKRAI